MLDQDRISRIRSVLLSGYPIYTIDSSYTNITEWINPHRGWDWFAYSLERDKNSDAPTVVYHEFDRAIELIGGHDLVVLDIDLENR